MDFDNTESQSVEMTEVAEPSDVESAEMTDAAAPSEPEPANEPAEAPKPQNDQQSKQDAAFAEMRRRNEELQRQLQEQSRIAQELQNALGLYFDGETAEDLSIAARAYAEERSQEDVRKDYEREREFQRLTAENKSLQSQLTDIQVDRLMHQALTEIQGIDPSVESLESLGESFANYIAAGLSTKEAYYASWALEANERVVAPPAIGKAKNMPVERDYYTSEELDQLTDEEINNNREKVWRSMNRL